MASLKLSNTVASPASRNYLLAALPPGDLAWLWPRLERVDLTFRQVLQRPDDPIMSVYFPESGWISMMALLADEGAAEVGLIGREGIVGIPLLFESEMSSLEAMVQAPGPALRLSAGAFREALKNLPAFRSVMLRYAMAFYEQVTHTAACNGRHVLEQRLARWLLMAWERAEGDEFPMTQDFLAIMLCVHRPGVTIAARTLQRANYIRYSSGMIKITDGAGLEAAACECYRTVRRQFERLLGVSQS